MSKHNKTDQMNSALANISNVTGNKKIEKEFKTSIENKNEKKDISEKINNEKDISNSSSEKINVFKSEKKETRDVRKQFLLTPSLNKKLRAYSKKHKMSENDIINKLIDMLNDE